jgi:hypothetical protein
MAYRLPKKTDNGEVIYLYRISLKSTGEFFRRVFGVSPEDALDGLFESETDLESKGIRREHLTVELEYENLDHLIEPNDGNRCWENN